MSFDLFHRNLPGRFYRGNLHTHTIRSDGGMSPEAVCAAYRQQGYDFLAITDHYLQEYHFPIVDTTPYRTDTFTTLIGSELHAPALSNGQIWHILAAGLPLDFGGLRDGETGPELAQRAIDAGAFVTLAHPEWYGATLEDLQSIPNAHAIETYNEVCARLNDKPASWNLFDHLAATGRRANAIGADDAHFRSAMPKPEKEVTLDLEALSSPSDFLAELQRSAVDPIANELGEETPAGFAAWVWVRADTLTPENILAALKAGDFYTSQGPAIHDIRISDDRQTISVVNSPAVSVFATGRPDLITIGGRHGSQITHWSAPIGAFRDSFVRVTIVDEAGKRAWSNPIWLD